MSLQRDILISRRHSSDSTSLSPQPPSHPPTQPSSRLSAHHFGRKASVSVSPNGRKTSSGEAVRVAVRVRPRFPNEFGHEAIVTMDPARNAVHIMSKTGEKQTFYVDMPLWSCADPALDGSALVSQSALYEKIGRPLLLHAFNGFNSTLMAYGQTGSGKTYTMMGKMKPNNTDGNYLKEVLSESEEGIIPRLCQEIFEEIQNRSVKSPSGRALGWEVHVSFVEVYCEKISDLLNHGTPVSIREEVIGNETRFLLSGARRKLVKNSDEMLQTLKVGNKCRKTAATSMNERSSRSHSIFIVELAEILTFTKSEGDMASAPRKCLTIRLVDLAGSERIGETGVSGHQFKEGVDINLSLFTLGMVIESLSDPNRRNMKPPYRDSTLTKILKDVFGGNSKTTMICTISPTEEHRAQTLQTLHYGSKARCVVNKPLLEKEPAAAELHMVNEELHNLSQKLSEGSYGSRDYQEVFRQLVIANENLRKEQDISRRAKVFREQKEAVLSDLYLKMEEQKRAYDRKVQMLEERLECVKVKRKKRERELQMACQNVEETAAGRFKELQAQYGAMEKHFKCQEKELQEKQQNTEKQLKRLESASKQRIDRLLQVQQDLEKMLKERESVNAKQEELQERHWRAENEVRQLEQRMALQEEEWFERQKIIEKKICEREGEVQRHQKDALERMRLMEEEAARREKEIHCKWIEAQRLADELQRRINTEESDMKRKIRENLIKAQNSELELQAKLQREEHDRKLREREVKVQQEQLDALRLELEAVSTSAFVKERDVVVHWAQLNEGLKKREEQVQQREKESNTKLEEALQMRLELESLKRRKAAEIEARYDEVLGVLRIKEVLIQQREDELRCMEQQLNVQSAAKDIEAKRKEIEFTTKIAEAEFLASCERRAAHHLQGEFDLALKGVRIEVKQREGRLGCLENSIKLHYAQLEESLAKRESLLQQRKADMVVQEQRLNERLHWSDQDFNTVERNTECIVALAHGSFRSINTNAERLATHMKICEEEVKHQPKAWAIESLEGRQGEIVTAHERVEMHPVMCQVKQDQVERLLVQKKTLPYLIKEYNEMTVNAVGVSSSLLHWGKLLLLAMEEHCRSLLESSCSSGCDLIKRFFVAMCNLIGMDPHHKGASFFPDRDVVSACQTGIQLQTEDFVMEQERLTERIAEFEQLRRKHEEDFHRKEEHLMAYLLEMEELDRERMEAYHHKEKQLADDFALLRRKKRALVRSVNRAWQVFLEQMSAQGAGYIAGQEAVEWECIECAFHMYSEVYLQPGATKGNLHSACRLLYLKRIGLSLEEQRLQVCNEQQQHDKAHREERIAAEEEPTQLCLLELEEGGPHRAHMPKEGERCMHEAEACHNEGQVEEILEKLICYLEGETMKRERNLQQREDRLRQQVTEMEGCLQKRTADLERRQLLALTAAEDNKLKLTEKETELEALIAKNKEVELLIQERDAELRHQRKHYTGLKRLLEDCRLRLQREHEHRINGKKSATQVAADLLEENDALQKQLKTWIRKYQVLKMEEKLECEECSWHNNRDTTICRCCGNSQLA